MVAFKKSLGVAGRMGRWERLPVDLMERVYAGPCDLFSWRFAPRELPRMAAIRCAIGTVLTQFVAGL
jgi:hypothetical protein